MTTHTHTTTKEPVTLIKELNVHNGLGIAHVVLKRKYGRTLTILKRKFERDWKINLVV